MCAFLFLGAVFFLAYVCFLCVCVIFVRVWFCFCVFSGVLFRGKQPLRVRPRSGERLLEAALAAGAMGGTCLEGASLAFVPRRAASLVFVQYVGGLLVPRNAAQSGVRAKTWAAWCPVLGWLNGNRGGKPWKTQIPGKPIFWEDHFGKTHFLEDHFGRTAQNTRQKHTKKNMLEDPENPNTQRRTLVSWVCLKMRETKKKVGFPWCPFKTNQKGSPQKDTPFSGAAGLTRREWVCRILKLGPSLKYVRAKSMVVCVYSVSGLLSVTPRNFSSDEADIVRLAITLVSQKGCAPQCREGCPLQATPHVQRPRGLIMNSHGGRPSAPRPFQNGFTLDPAPKH